MHNDKVDDRLVYNFLCIHINHYSRVLLAPQLHVFVNEGVTIMHVQRYLSLAVNVALK